MPVETLIKVVLVIFAGSMVVTAVTKATNSGADMKEPFISILTFAVSIENEGEYLGA